MSDPDRCTECGALRRKELAETLAAPGAPGLRSEALPLRYQPRGELGRGGMGAVLCQYDPVLDREVAMKVMLDPRPERAARFEWESRVTGKLAHPGVPPVYELGRRPDGPYFTMKRVEGVSLEELLVAEEPPPLEQLLEILLKVCDTLAYAHAHGVVHRDLKPENVMVGDYGEVLVMDWGLAKLVGESEVASASTAGDASPPDSPTQLTLDGTVMGTPAYMPPEQARGELDAIDARSDVFSAGGILFHMLYGRPPYDGQTVGELLGRAKAGQIEWPARSSCPPELVAIARKALAPSPRHRFPDVEQLAADLRAFRDYRPVSVYRDTMVKQLAKLARRHPTRTALVAAALLALIGGGVGYGQYQRSKLTAQRKLTRLAERQATAAAARARAVVPFVTAIELRQGATTAEQLTGRVVALLQQALKIDPTLDEAALTLGGVYQQTLQLAKAEAVFERLLARRPDDASVAFELGLTRILRGDLAAAREAWQLLPDGPRARLAAAWIALRSDRVDAARSALARLSDQPSIAWAVHWLRGLLQFEPGGRGAALARSPSQGRQELDRVLELRPQFTLARVHRALSWLADKQPGPAREDVRKAGQLVEEHPLMLYARAWQARADRGSGKQKALTLLDRALREGGERYPAIAVMRVAVLRTLRRDADAAAAVGQLRARFERTGRPGDGFALVEVLNGRTDAARIERLLGRLAGKAPARTAMVRAAQVIGHKRGAQVDAVRFLRKAIELRPDSPLPYAELARIQAFHAGRLPEALALIGKAYERFGSNGRVLKERARILGRAAELDRSRIDAAVAAHRQLRDVYRNDGIYFEMLGTLYGRLGMEVKAERCYLAGMAIADENGEPARSLGYLGPLYMRRGERRRAIAVFERIIRERPEGDRFRASCVRAVRRLKLELSLLSRDPKTPQESGVKGQMLEHQRRWSAAVPYLDRALDWHRGRTDRGRRYRELELLLSRARCLLELGRWAAGQADGQRIVGIADGFRKLVSRGVEMPATMLHNVELFLDQGLEIALVAAAQRADQQDLAFELMRRCLKRGGQAARAKLARHRSLRRLHADPRWRRLIGG